MPYPHRPKMFSLRFIRVLIKSGAIQEIGQGAVAMLIAVVTMEDEKRYTGAVCFWNDHLKAQAGFLSWKALDTARDRAVAAGWLHYEPGGKHRAGRYWVTIPDRLEVLMDGGLGDGSDLLAACREQAPSADGSVLVSPENGSSVPRPLSTSTGDGGEIESGSSHPSSPVDSTPGRSTGDRREIDGRSTANHSTLSLSYPNPSPVRDAAEPTLDPDEQDITAPAKPSADVPRPTDPRGTENDRVQLAPGKLVAVAPTDPVHGLGVWIRWRANDASRQSENAATIRALIRDHGAAVVQRIAERLQREGAADRDRKPGDKVWVDELLPAILAEQASRSQPAGSTNGPNPSDPTPQPEIVTQALALLASRGAAVCRAALGWAPHIAPTDVDMRAAISREPVATELVDVLTNGPLVMVEP